MTYTSDLTSGDLKKKMIRFALPYLLASFLQTFYGMVDLYVVGLYNGASTTTAVSIGSQVTHMLTVIIVGLAMGTTVRIGQAVGAKKPDDVKLAVTTTVWFYIGFAILITIGLLFAAHTITIGMRTPGKAIVETDWYLRICFAGVPFIVAFNVISSIFRGMGDSKSPMCFVGIACLVNVILDFALVGGFHMGAAGAALATIIGQAVSVLMAFVFIKKRDFGFTVGLREIKRDAETLSAILKVGLPISLQDGLIQVSFVVITMIANGRGLIAAAAVGIVEKLICFMFLVPSAFLSAISAITAQNMGAGKPDRARKALYFGLAVTVSWGLVCAIFSNIFGLSMVGLFTKDAEVIVAGNQYLSSYSVDCMIAAIHFCFSGYFSGCQKSIISFIHNITSIALIRIPGTYIASMLWPDTLLPMGMAAPAGSLLSALICVVFYLVMKKQSVKQINIIEN